MTDIFKQKLFTTAMDFRAWLQENCLLSEGIWLVFGKQGGPQTLTSYEALEEALCFGWIDSQIKSIDEKAYRKYFAQRQKKTEWSAKNIALANSLESQGRMTDFGRIKIEEAKASGHFEPKKHPAITDEQINAFMDEIKHVEPAYANFLAMSPSVRRVYTGYSLDVKSEAARKNRLIKIIDRLNQNLKPM